jgi:hypothetical protein
VTLQDSVQLAAYAIRTDGIRQKEMVLVTGSRQTVVVFAVQVNPAIALGGYEPGTPVPGEPPPETPALLCLSSNPVP